MFLWSFIHWFNVCDIYFYSFLHHIIHHDAHLFFRSWLSFFSFERKCCHYLHLSNSTGLRNFHFVQFSFSKNQNLMYRISFELGGTGSPGEREFFSFFRVGTFQKTIFSNVKLNSLRKYLVFCHIFAFSFLFKTK